MRLQGEDRVESLYAGGVPAVAGRAVGLGKTSLVGMSSYRNETP